MERDLALVLDLRPWSRCFRPSSSASIYSPPLARRGGGRPDCSTQVTGNVNLSTNGA